MMRFDVRLTELITLIRGTFANESIYLTCRPLKQGEAQHPSTFAADNITDLDIWTLLMQAKICSGNIDAVALVLRIFRNEKTHIQNEEGVRVEVPYKDLYMFLAEEAGVTGFDLQTTLDMHCTYAPSGEPISPEPAVNYKASIDLLTEAGYQPRMMIQEKKEP
ncbi:MAG: hypothetical protein KKB90_10175 [Actinobacteria bacterium]|nr:hypothetical protein [Actinomycetota bacterium]MCG2817675.1 hypothetical protein [Actinomycetes bacterium]MBU4219312.1 hypothetical protein [Actinomycetota bacterium]MBU4359596.1 hypothetical protein [Actinomycetota bacterium]MBU4392159.1 hypothetical protein [Actinomycetota bacterium]